MLYELVQAYRPQSRQPLMPHAISTRLSNVWYHTDRHEQWKRVTQPELGPGLGASTEYVSRPVTGLQNGKKYSGVSVGEKKTEKFLFSERTASRRSEGCLYEVSRKYLTNWLRRLKLSLNYSPKSSLH